MLVPSVDPSWATNTPAAWRQPACVVTSQINTLWSFSRVLRSLDWSCCHLLSLCTSLECEFTGSSTSIYHARAANCLCKCSCRVQCSDTVPSATEPGIRKHTHRSTHGWSPPAKTVPIHPMTATPRPQKNTNISVENPERSGKKTALEQDETLSRTQLLWRDPLSLL